MLVVRNGGLVFPFADPDAPAGGEPRPALPAVPAGRGRAEAEAGPAADRLGRYVWALYRPEEDWSGGGRPGWRQRSP